MRRGIPHINEVNALDGYKLFVSFTDGVKGVIDLSADKDKEVFQIWNDRKAFENVFLSDHGSIAWNDEVEIDVLNVYLTLTDQTFEKYADS